jgi:hypothetical protein
VEEHEVQCIAAPSPTTTATPHCTLLVGLLQDPPPPPASARDLANARSHEAAASLSTAVGILRTFPDLFHQVRSIAVMNHQCTYSIAVMNHQCTYIIAVINQC